jgi:cation-transporting ATPase 13A1
LRNLQELRAMSQQPYDIHVRRNQRWVTIKTDQLLPGDLVSIVRGKSDDITVPCDVVLIAGSCIVNEAMLSGESTPLMKESIQPRTEDEVFHIKSNDYKANILFGGTKVLQENGPVNHPFACPDGGCLGFVLRTGFGTTQGKLVRTMVRPRLFYK